MRAAASPAVRRSRRYLQQRLVKTGGRLVKHARYYWLPLAENHLTRRLFGPMLQRIWARPCQPADGRAFPEAACEERKEGGEVFVGMSGGVVPRFTIRAAWRAFRCEIDTGVNPGRTRSLGCRMRPINGGQIRNVGQLLDWSLRLLRAMEWDGVGHGRIPLRPGYRRPIVQ